MKDNNDMTMLVSEAKEGSQAAYEALYQKTKQMVYFTCFSLLKSEADAADQMQETYATAFQKLDMLDDPEKFSGWINRIAINKCKNFLVQHKQWLPLSEEKFIPAENSELEKAFLPEAYIMQQDKREIVQRIMRAELSDVQYRTILLYYYDELSLAEIAEWMECSEGTVKSRLHKAKELIREGVLKYSKRHDDKLYCIGVLPFLARLLQLEAEQLQAPALDLNYLQNINGPNSANQQKLKQHLQQKTKLKQGKEKLVMQQNGLLSATKGKILAASLALLVLIGGIAGALAITDHDGQRNENQGNINQEDHGQETETGGSDNGERTVDSEEEDLIAQISFTDAATGEDYLSGHIESIISYGRPDEKHHYMVLDDKHNLYLCTEQTDTYDIYKEGSQAQWRIELLYENTKLDAIENIWYTRHYNLYTGDLEAAADGHEECQIIYGNGYIYRDGEEYDLNAIVPVKGLTPYSFTGFASDLLIVDTSGNLHYWEGGRGLDTLNENFPEYNQVGIWDYFEAPVREEFQQGNCVDICLNGWVLTSDGKLVLASVPVEWDYAFEQLIAMEGVKALYSRGFVVLDTEDKIHINMGYMPDDQERSEEIVDRNCEGEILDIYCQAPCGMLIQTTEGYYFSSFCRHIAEAGETAEALPFRKLNGLDSVSSSIKEFVVSSGIPTLRGFGNAQFLLLLEDGTVWGFIEDYEG